MFLCETVWAATPHLSDYVFQVLLFGLAILLIGSQFPDQGLNSGPQQWKSWLLTTRLPGNSPNHPFWTPGYLCGILLFLMNTDFTRRLLAVSCEPGFTISLPCLKQMITNTLHIEAFSILDGVGGAVSKSPLTTCVGDTGPLLHMSSVYRWSAPPPETN